MMENDNRTIAPETTSASLHGVPAVQTIGLEWRCSADIRGRITGQIHAGALVRKLKWHGSGGLVVIEIFDTLCGRMLNERDTRQKLPPDAPDPDLHREDYCKNCLRKAEKHS